MSFFKGLIDSLGEIFPVSPTSNDHPHNSPQNPPMETPVSNERISYKLKWYFELAKEEIAKAVRAEEWGLIEDAISHYKNAHRILLEAKETRSPSLISASEQEKVNSYHQKISKWQGQVSERLQVLSRRAGRVSVTNKNGGNHPKHVAISSTVTAPTKDICRKPSLSGRNNLPLGSSTNNNGGNHPKHVAISSTVTAPTKDICRKPSLSGRNNLPLRSPTNNVGNSKPVQESSNGLDAKLVEMINTVIVDRSPSVKWADVAGLEKAKQSLLEMVILPTKRRDLFTGLRRPARGLLLFGPPGNGKTMLAKAVASESEATFFNVSASSLTSKWVGEAEKLVKTLFMVAISRQPSVIFIDEIDSIMSTRMANENDSSRRLKSEFLVQFDGVTSNSDDLVIVIGATNKPQELDDAVLRRLVKKIYIPLPDENVRQLILKTKLKGQAFSLPGKELERLAKETEGYSGSDLQALCEEAAMMPIRELGSNILTVKANQLRSLNYGDFQKAMSAIRPSLLKSKWDELEKWNQEFGAN